MKFAKQQVFLMLVMGICMILVLPQAGNALVKANDSEKAFLGSTALKSTGLNSGATLRDYLIQGAGFFLDSYSDSLSFLKNVEMSELEGVDYSILTIPVNCALMNMEKANVAYWNLKQLADIAEYDESVIFQLKQFNYSVFMRTHKLNRDIFKKLEDFMRMGDIRGAYHEMLKDTDAILDILSAIKLDVDAQRFPSISSLWGLNQAYSESLLFGQYMAAIFSEILNK